MKSNVRRSTKQRQSLPRDRALASLKRDAQSLPRDRALASLKRDALVCVVGGGPAGLAAASSAREAGAAVLVTERKRSVGRKFLVAGKGGLNVTHSEPLERFLSRYHDSSRLELLIRTFPPERVRAFADSLGQTTWVGSSGRVFPKAGKAAPMLRAWIARLKRDGVRFRTQTTFLGMERGAIEVEGPAGREVIHADAFVLALGGGSWSSTGSDGGWVPILRKKGIEVADLVPSNAGVLVSWPQPFLDEMEGGSIKGVRVTLAGESAPGDLNVTRSGLEGTPVYALSTAIREAVARDGRAVLSVDLFPDLTREEVGKRLESGGSKSIGTRLKSLLSPSKLALLRSQPKQSGDLAARLKAFPIPSTGLRPLEEAISSAGGVLWEGINDRMMLVRQPGFFVAGEMIDWDAPTGGYLLQACFATGAAAGEGAAEWAKSRES